jgi:protoporphyrinogen oxidase
MQSATDIAILGAGMAGLSTAYHLRRDYQIYERCDDAGGLCGSKKIDGFIFDHGPHLYFSTNAYVVSLLKKLLKNNLLQNRSRPGQYYRGVVVPYPYTVNLHGLPQEIIAACIAGFREAADLRRSASEPRTYSEWCHYHYGNAFTEHFMLPYAKNYWAVDPHILNTEWIGNKIYAPTLEQIEAGAQARHRENLYYYNTYRYPRHGGAGALPRAFLNHVKEPLTGMQAETIDLATKTISFADGSEVNYDTLVSTIPLPRLVKLIKDAPQAVKSAAQNLQCNSVICILIGLDKPRKSDFSWIYFNDYDACFYRVCFPEHFSANNVPQGKGGMWVEVSYSAFKPIDKENIIDKVITDLKKTGFLSENDNIQVTSVHDLKNAYVIYDKHRRHSRDRIHSYLGAHGVFSRGRFGEWAHMWTHEVILSTRALAEQLNPTPAISLSSEATADSYRFMDTADTLLLSEDD